MSLIKYVPNPVLLEKTSKIDKFDSYVTDLEHTLVKELSINNGIGLAANQIGESVAMAVIKLPGWGTHMTIINPVLSQFRYPLIVEEGCLSIPRFQSNRMRYDRVTIRYQDITGKPIKLKANNTLAVVFQHETDHLNGLLFVDHTKLKVNLDALSANTSLGF